MRKWTQEEIEYLKSLSNERIDIYEVSKKLNRTLGSVCTKIYRILGKDLRQDIIGSRRRAVNRYNLILYRISHTDYKKNNRYKNIKMLIPKEEFVSWFMKNDFKNASVDRIDNKGDYTLDNIALISLTDNVRKDKLKERNGLVECCCCHEIKPLNEMVFDRRRLNGHGTLCKKCDVLRKI